MPKNQNTYAKKWRENEKKRKAEEKRHNRRRRKETAADAVDVQTEVQTNAKPDEAQNE